PHTAPAPLLAATLRQLRQNPGLRNDLLRYLSQDQAVVEQLQSLQKYEILFNYTGQLSIADKPLVLRPSVENCHMRRTDDRADYVLECWPAVMNGMLRVRWTFSEQLHQ